MEIEFSDRAIEDIDYWKKSGNVAVQKKITRLFESIKKSPHEGIGKSEPLTFIRVLRLLRTVSVS